MRQTCSRVAIAGLSASAVIAAATACRSTNSARHELTVVASTSVWGSIAEEIAGGDARVVSVVTNPAADPHSFNASASDIAALIDADLMILNGGGYDPWAEKAAGQRKDKSTINAVDVFEASKGIAGGEVNEHVWYDLPTVTTLANQIADQLGKLKPDHRDKFIQSAAKFNADLAQTEAILNQIAQAHPHQPVAQTEPIALHMLNAAAADDRTPREFEHAIEDGTDPSPESLAAVMDLVATKKVRALVYNIQTENKTTKHVLEAANASSLPVIEVTETLPSGSTFLGWMSANANSLARALS